MLFDIKILTEVNIFKKFFYDKPAAISQDSCAWEVEENFHYQGKDIFSKSIAVVKSLEILPFKTWEKQGFLTLP